MARGDLKSAITGALNRQDLDGVVDTWIQAATTRLNTILRHRAMIRHQVLRVTGRTFAAPGDFIEAESVQINGAPPDLGPVVAGQAVSPMLYAPPSEITGAAAADPRCQNGFPRYYTMHGLQFELAPWKPGSQYQMELRYYGKIALAMGPDATNFFLDEYPHVYLNCAMAFGHRFLMEPDTALGYEQLFMAEIQAINDSEAEAKIGNGPLIVPPQGGAFTRGRRPR